MEPEQELKLEQELDLHLELDLLERLL